MQKAYKILLITYFTVTIGCANSLGLWAYAPPKLALILTSDVENAAESPLTSTSFSEYSHNTYKITKATRKINTALVRKGADLLVHFTEINNQVVVRVSDMQGNLIKAVYHPAVEAGFYEIPVLPANDQSSLYFVSLIVNQQTYSFQVSSQPQ